MELSVNYNADYTYRWLLNGGETGQDTNILSVKPAMDGTYNYRVQVENLNNCMSNSINTVTVTVNASPAFTLSG